MTEIQVQEVELRYRPLPHLVSAAIEERGRKFETRQQTPLSASQKTLNVNKVKSKRMKTASRISPIRREFEDVYPCYDSH
jgi:pantothenate kinase